MNNKYNSLFNIHPKLVPNLYPTLIQHIILLELMAFEHINQRNLNL